MMQARVRTALVVFLFLSFFAGFSRAQTPSNRDADTAAIHQLVASFADRWNAHDAHALSMFFVEDGEFTNIRGEASHGRKELEDHYTTVLNGFLKNAHTTDTVKSVRFLGPDLATVDMDWLVNDPAMPGGVRTKGLLTWVVAKRNGQWLITIYHEFAFQQ